MESQVSLSHGRLLTLWVCYLVNLALDTTIGTVGGDLHEPDAFRASSLSVCEADLAI